MMIPHLLSIGGSILFSVFVIPVIAKDTMKVIMIEQFQTHYIFASLILGVVQLVLQIHHHNWVNYTFTMLQNIFCL